MQYFKILYSPWFRQVAQDMDLRHPQSVFFMFGNGTPPLPALPKRQQTKLCVLRSIV